MTREELIEAIVESDFTDRLRSARLDRLGAAYAESGLIDNARFFGKSYNEDDARQLARLNRTIKHLEHKLAVSAGPPITKMSDKEFLTWSKQARAEKRKLDDRRGEGLATTLDRFRNARRKHKIDTLNKRTS